MKYSALALMLGLPAAFAAGWWLRPSEENPAVKNRLTPAASHKSQTPAGRPGNGAIDHGTKPAQGRDNPRTFPKGGALAWLQSLGGVEAIQSSAGKDALQEILETFTAEEFAELDRAVQEQMKDFAVPRSQKMLAGHLLMLAWPEWVRLDPAATLASMSWPGEANGEVSIDFRESDTVQTVFRRYADKDQEAAIAAIGRMPENRRKDAGHGIMMAAARRDPFAALELIPQLGASASSDPRMFVDAAAARDPMRTAALTGPISGDARRDNTFLRTMEEWMKKDPAAAAAWMEAYQGPGRTTGLTAVLAAQAKTDAAGAAARFLTLENSEQNPYTPRLAMNIALGLTAQSNPADALDWAANLPAHFAGDTTTEAMRSWAMKDAAAASEWLRTQPPGVVWDSAAYALAESIRSTDAERAWEWAKSIADPVLGNAALRLAGETWKQQDAAAAQAALDSLSADQRSSTQSEQSPAR